MHIGNILLTAFSLSFSPNYRPIHWCLIVTSQNACWHVYCNIKYFSIKICQRDIYHEFTMTIKISKSILFNIIIFILNNSDICKYLKIYQIYVWHNDDRERKMARGFKYLAYGRLFKTRLINVIIKISSSMFYVNFTPAGIPRSVDDS